MVPNRYNYKPKTHLMLKKFQPFHFLTITSFSTPTKRWFLTQVIGWFVPVPLIAVVSDRGDLFLPEVAPVQLRRTGLGFDRRQRQRKLGFGQARPSSLLGYRVVTWDETNTHRWALWSSRGCLKLAIVRLWVRILAGKAHLNSDGEGSLASLTSSHYRI